MQKEDTNPALGIWTNNDLNCKSGEALRPPAAGQCVSPNRRNYSATWQRVVGHWSGTKIPQISIWESIRGTCWNKSNPWRPHLTTRRTQRMSHCQARTPQEVSCPSLTGQSYICSTRQMHTICARCCNAETLWGYISFMSDVLQLTSWDNMKQQFVKRL